MYNRRWVCMEENYLTDRTIELEAIDFGELEEKMLLHAERNKKCDNCLFHYTHTPQFKCRDSEDGKPGCPMWSWDERPVEVPHA